jgi:hypothetical protein
MFIWTLKKKNLVKNFVWNVDVPKMSHYVKHTPS